RLSLNPNHETPAPYAEQKALGYSSYTFGDPATPIPRSYLGEPSKTRLVHGGSEVFHVHHLHGGGDRWRRNPKSDPHNDISSGLNKRPHQHVFSTHLDSQSIGPGTSYNLEHECGAGGCQQAAGDFLYHCHIGQHYLTGMWSFWRVFDTRQDGLAKLPDMPAPPEAVDSTQLVGKTFEGKTIVVDAKPRDSSQIRLSEWVESQLPSKGERIDFMDATVWDWTVGQKNGLPLYLGEPETNDAWANYTPEEKGERFAIRFNPLNGRYAWPIFRPHLGQRPPFSPNGHSGTPWLGEQGSTERPDGLCPDPDKWNIPGQTIRHYPISAVNIDIPANVQAPGMPGMLFVLNEDLIGESPEGKAILSRFKENEPLAIRSNVGDCTRIIFTNKLDLVDRNPDMPNKAAAKPQRVNMHTHFVQFDPQASDGVITGLSYEQSIFPYRSERRIPASEDAGSDTQPRRLVAATAAGADTIRVNQIYRFKDNQGNIKKGIWIGIG
ncbi:MAG: hypothetical protein ACRERS_05810, partial [Methylococcales bacterium]